MTTAQHTPGYEITADGRVLSIASGWRGHARREMRQDLDDHGYPSVRLTVAGKRIRVAVHRLVAANYLPPRPSPTHEIRHLDGNKMNNSAGNLAWGTRKENAEDRQRHGRTSRGAKHGAAIKASAKWRRYWEARA